MIRKIRMQNEEGFTLIELMIVIAIIGILAAIAIPNFIAYRNKGFCSSAESDAHNIASTISDYFAIPANTDIAVVAAGATSVQFGTGATYDLSGDNTCQITVTPATSTVPIQIGIIVSDVSTRCPADYRNSQSNAGWSTTTNTFTKNM